MPISELNDSERDWLEAHLQVARSFVETFVAPQNPLTPESLEAAWSAWLPTALDEPEMANTIVNATGFRPISMRKGRACPGRADAA